VVRRAASANLSRILVVALSFAVVVAGIVLSPLALTWLGDSSADWKLLADVGQAYGGASAILSGLAFCGIATSLILQWRQFRSSLLYSVKQRHFELVKLALENPEFLYVDGEEVARDPDVQLKVYGNLLVNHWAMTWDMGFMTESALRQSGRRLFLSTLARDWWLTWGTSYLGTRRRQRFVQILNDEAGAAECTTIGESVPAVADARQPTQPDSGGAAKKMVLVAGAFSLGVATAAATARIAKRRRFLDEGGAGLSR